MKYQDIQKGQQYGSRLVLTIQHQESDGAGPGLELPSRPTDEVAYQDFAEGVRTRCTAVQFAKWVSRQEETP